MALTGTGHRRGIAVVALAISACALGPASSAGAATPLDQVASEALAAAGQLTTQVDATANGVNATLERTGSAVDGVGRATGTAVREAAPADAGPAVDIASGATGGAAGTVASAAPTVRSVASPSIHETAGSADRGRRLSLTSRRQEGAASSARAGVGIEAARGTSAIAPAVPPGPAGAERRESSAAPSLLPGIPGTGLGFGDGGVVTGGAALLLTAFALMLLIGGPVPPALSSALRMTAGVRRTPPPIFVLDRPG